MVGGVGLGIQSTIVIFAFWRARIHSYRTPEFSLGPMTLIGVIMILLYAIGALLTISAL
ncbi:MAG: hypothetical protein UZ22_OP11002000506 [Microgenomates bacterium OLB23]|nr:MAG: hypothetical protein UZ22_OP11002000506 [Microgenomates bacterium OLB23]